jgi:hypothetical protein
MGIRFFSLFLATKLHCTHLHATCAISCKHENLVKTKYLYDSYSKDKCYQNSEYEAHQVGSKYLGSRNYCFLAFKGEGVASIQISSYARDRRKLFFAKILFVVKICDNFFFHFFRHETNTFPIFHMK